MALVFICPREEKERGPLELLGLAFPAGRDQDAMEHPMTTTIPTLKHISNDALGDDWKVYAPRDFPGEQSSSAGQVRPSPVRRTAT